MHRFVGVDGTTVVIDDDSITFSHGQRRMVVDRSYWEMEENAGWELSLAVATALTDGLDAVKALITSDTIDRLLAEDIDEAGVDHVLDPR